MADLRLANLSKSFGTRTRPAQTHALRGLSLSLAAGECLALVGPSGAGKTTALRLVAGLDTPSGGDILLDGESIVARPPAQRSVAMAFQYPALLPQLTARENIELGARLRRKPRDVSEIAGTLGLARLLDRKPETLSGGEQQRVALGRALANEPAVLLLDEPLVNLDPLSRQELRQLIRRVQRQLKITTLYVTHDQAEAAAVADRIAILRDGVLQQAASAEELYCDPANLFVARFFGRDGLNTLEGAIQPRGNDCVLAANGSELRLTCPCCTPRKNSVTAAFRPRSTRPIEGGSGWTIEERRDYGWGSTLHLDHGIICELEDAGRFSAGDRVGLEARELLFFDPGSGQRLR